MAQEDKRRRVAEAAIEYVVDESVIGVGTGRTMNYFITALGRIKHRIEGAVASSLATEERLQQQGIPVIPLNSVGDLPVYIDSADEAVTHGSLIKGGGGALSREKVVAAASQRFVCILDDSKLVDVLGHFPVAVEVLPFARSHVARRCVALGGQPRYREGFVTDNGQSIIDISFLKILQPAQLEAQLDAIPGTICNGLFAARRADTLLLADDQGIQVL